jgi:hypothetical protein
MRRVFKFISFFSFAVILLTGCDGNLPPEQKEFNNKIKSFQSEYNSSAGNDIAEDNVCEEFDNFVEGRICSNWEASVIEVNSFLGSRWVVANAGGISFKLWPENDDNWANIGEQILGKLQKGDKVIFSGVIIREMSFTCSGKISEPEIKVDPSSVKLK